MLKNHNLLEQINQNNCFLIFHVVHYNSTLNTTTSISNTSAGENIIIGLSSDPAAIFRYSYAGSTTWTNIQNNSTIEISNNSANRMIVYFSRQSDVSVNTYNIYDTNF